MFAAKDLARLIQPSISAKVLRTPGGWEAGRLSWLLRYPETSLKNDFICCKKKKSFIIDPSTSWRLSWLKLCPFTSSFRCEKVSGGANGVPPICVINSYFLSFMYIFTNLPPFFMFLCCVSGGRKKMSSYSTAKLRSCSKTHFVRVVSLWKNE